MGARGTFYALNVDLEGRLLAAATLTGKPTAKKYLTWITRGLTGIGGFCGPEQDWVNEKVFGAVCDLWGATTDEEKCPVDSTWYWMHCCLTGGKEEPRETDDSRELCVLGGRQLCRGSDHIVAFKDVGQVVRVSVALSEIEKDWLIGEYHRVVPRSQRNGPEDPDCTWEYFQAVRIFYDHAARTKRSVVFHVSL